MAFHAVLDVTNAFLKVLSTNPARLVLMTGEAGVRTEIAIGMAGRTRRLVRSDQWEKPGVIECGGLPAVLTVTCGAVRRLVSMKVICWRHMATSALHPHRVVQECV